MSNMKGRATAVQEKIERAAHAVNRSPDSVVLIAVTKTWPVDVLLEAYDAGLRHFGENRVYELEEKRPAIEARLGKDSGIVWHFIGNLQSRKSKSVAAFADTFHAVDRLKIVNRLQRDLAENGRSLQVFIEVNVSGEESKAGLDCTNINEDATQQEQLRKVAQAIVESPNLTLLGIMSMAPWGAPEEEIRTVFTKTHQTADWLQEQLGWKRPLQLSMGMTDDFPIAIAEGATHVRVGRALFGERK